MYPHDDRTRAVELHIKLGKRAAATVRQLGYPTKNALKGWHQEFEQRHDLPLGYVRSKSKYSDEQKRRNSPTSTVIAPGFAGRQHRI